MAVVTVAELITALSLDESTPDLAVTATRLLEVATALVEEYAPAAPDPVRAEAIIRCAGWLHQTPSSSFRAERVGEYETQRWAGSLSALRHSGAMALLTRYKQRRAGAIG